ncbi:hypothetical protein [Hymenobacter sp. UYP22]|uniref:hypothetical protein n=1 Tax=Hymenobacter sp. UYP22 TaxID=3156348 RepID=UPI00339644FD
MAKRISVLAGLLAGSALLAPAVQAQDIYEYLPDSVGKRLVRQAHVRRLTWLLEDTRYYHEPRLYKEMAFDSKGRMSAYRYAHDKTIYGFRYDESGQRHLVYTQQPGPTTDLTTLDPDQDQSRTRTEYDALGNPVLELHERAGQVDTLRQRRTVEVADTTWEHEMESPHNLHVTRTFLQDNGRTLRYDFLKYRHPKYNPEGPNYLAEVKSYYNRYDAQKREIESGSVDFEQGMEEWLEQRMAQELPLPGGYQQFLYGGGLLQLVLKGRIPGQFRPSKSTRYNKLGQVAETWSTYQGGLRRYRYNAAGQLLEILLYRQREIYEPAGDLSGRVVLTWGAVGLPVRVEQQDADGKPVQISTYSYELFPAAASAPAEARKRKKGRVSGGLLRCPPLGRGVIGQQGGGSG